MRLLRSGLIALAVAAVGTSGALGGASAGTPPVMTTPPSISGTAQKGQTLTAQSGSWSGTTPISFAYQWRRCSASGGDCVDVKGATAQTYTLGSSDVGHTLRLQATASNSAGSAQALSGPTAVVVSGGPPVNVSAPTLSGTTKDGDTLSVSRGTWTSGSSISYAYKWVRCDTAGNNCSTISGATHSSYRLGSSDVGHRVQAFVVATNSAGSTQAWSSPSDVVRPAGTAPQNTAKPSLSGTPREGQALTVSAGTWSGTQPITLSFRWVRCGPTGGAPCDTIPGATGQVYFLGGADVDRTVQAFVTATNALGSTQANTPPSGAIASAGPAGAVKLSNGLISIPVTSVSLPERLIVAGVSFTPKRISARAVGTVVRFRIVDTRGHVVRDALVYAVGLPTAWIQPLPERRTGLDGTVSFRIRPTAQLPLRPGGSLAIFVRARKSGENPLAGVSGSRLFQVGLGRR